MRARISGLVGVILLGAAAFWWVTAPDPLPARAVAGLSGDAHRGEAVFWAGGCASCHAAKGAEGAARLQLGGGQRLVTQFGTFVVPNISPSAQGIGGWSALDLANAMLRGVTPAGAHLYPAFPYASYAHASLQDVVDLKAYLDQLPPVATPDQPHELRFPFTIRRLIGGWKWLFLRPGWVVAGPLPPEAERGRALVEGLGHCGECHTPRNAFGAMERSAWLAGAPLPTGKGRTPNLTPQKLDWSVADIANYLKTGFTPAFDSAGGEMADVVENLSHLPDADLAAMAAYLKLVPRHE